MKTIQMSTMILMLVVASVLATACAPAATQAPATEAPATEVPAEATACPTVTSNTKLLTNTEDGYCLLYPADAVSNSNMPGWVVINPISAPGDIPGDAWFYIQVQDATGKTAAQFVDEQIAALGEGFNISTSEVEVGGEQGVMVDGLPGQDSNRQVFMVHHGRLYNLVFAPWFPNAAEPTPLENLYTMVIHTFRFLP